MPKKPYRVGLTGGLGAGKTTVARILSCLGIPVYCSDDRARYLMENDSGIKQNLITYFGKFVILDNQRINRDFLAGEVFNNPEKLKLLNGVVHPAVARDFEKWVDLHMEADYVVKEAALLFETGGSKLMDFMITVSAPETIRIARVKKRDLFRSDQEILEILNRQMSEIEKVDKADFVVVNKDNTPLVIPQVLHIHQEIKEASTK